ncbi:Cdc6/Cdc18 family protein [Candidatus Hodarchaeum mangrovi]
MKDSNFEISRFFENKSNIFRDESIFSPSYIPNVLIHREDTLRQLTNYFKSIFTLNFPPSGKSVIIQGSVGLGKTVVVKKFGKAVETFCKSSSSRPSMKIIYFHINCRRQRTWYLVLTSILRHFILAFPPRGYSTDELIQLLTRILKERNQHLLLCLDEIDYLIIDKKSQDELYSLIRGHEEDLNDNRSHISLILITRDPHFLLFLDSALYSSLSQTIIVFSKYSEQQLYEILIDRANSGLKSTTYTEEVIRMIASLTYEVGDVRYAIELLWRAAKLAESESSSSIEFEHVRKSHSCIMPIKKSVITDLPIHQQFILMALALLLINDRSKSQITTMKLKEKYYEICKKNRLNPRRQTQFWGYLQKLSALGLIKLNVYNKHKEGKSLGRTTCISIHSFSAEQLVEQINNFSY